MELVMETGKSAQYLRAKKKVREIKSFYYNLSLYCIIIPMFIFFNLRYTPEFYWFFFPMIGWGFGLAVHAMGAFNYNPLFGKEWEARKLQEIMDKENKKHQNLKNL